MRRVLKVTGAVCLGIFIWIVLMVCLLLIWKSKAEGVIEGLDAIPTEAPSDLTGSKAEEDKEENVNLTVDITDSSLPMQNTGREEIYFDSVQEAVDANYINFDEECLYQRNLKNVIKEFEVNNYIVVCYNAIKNPREEAFIIAYFKIREEGKDKKYAYVWNEIQERRYSKEPKIELEELIRNEIDGSNFRMMNSIQNERRFICGTIDEIFLENVEDVYNLKIEGQKPDEIIEYESFGRTWYFWYYNDLQSDKKNDELEITLK